MNDIIEINALIPYLFFATRLATANRWWYYFRP